MEITSITNGIVIDHIKAGKSMELYSILGLDELESSVAIIKNVSSKKMGKKAVRLDALSCNTPAHHLYNSLGFEKRGQQRWYADNVGWTDFFLFEFVM